MEQEVQEKNYTIYVSDSFTRTDENHRYEPAFRRWLVREIKCGNMNAAEAIKRFGFSPTTGHSLISRCVNKYSPELFVPSDEMTKEEKDAIKELERQLRESNKQNEYLKMHVIALNTLIDVAQEKLSIDIRKKPGTRQ